MAALVLENLALELENLFGAPEGRGNLVLENLVLELENLHFFEIEIEEIETDCVLRTRRPE